MARLEVSVRPATDADVRPLAAVMGRALEDDSPFVWMLYQHFGFEPSGPMPLPAGVPVITPMWRVATAQARG